MAEEEKRRSFPSIPSRNWWDLRARFKQSIPGKVDADYIQAVLSVGLGHAKNLIPQLVTVGLIGEDGKPTDLAMDWRDDTTYPAACPEDPGVHIPPGDSRRPAATQPGPECSGTVVYAEREGRRGCGRENGHVLSAALGLRRRSGRWGQEKRSQAEERHCEGRTRTVCPKRHTGTIGRGCSQDDRISGGVRRR